MRAVGLIRLRFAASCLTAVASAFVFAFAPLAAEAASPVKVLVVRGKCSVDGKRELEEGETFTNVFSLKTGGEDSYVKLYTTRWDHTLILGKHTEISVDTTQVGGNHPYTLKKGTLRWVSPTAFKAAQGEHEPLLTPNAALILRGTDFLLSYDEINGETEVYVFEGAVEVVPRADKKSGRIVHENKWGGLGGRFGAKVEPWKLSVPQVDRQRRRLLP